MIADLADGFGRPATRKYPLILLYRAKDLGDLRDSLLTYYRGDTLAWSGALTLSIFFPPFRPLLALAIIMVCLSIAMAAAIWLRHPIRFAVSILPGSTLGTITYYVTLAYIFFAADMLVLAIALVAIIHIVAEATFFMRSRRLVRQYADLTPP